MKKIDINTVNKVKYENLDCIGDSIFEEVYRRADKLLYGMVLESREALKAEAEPVSNVISFLGERGRGKTSAMLSFLASLDRLKKQGEDGWSKLRECGEVKFIRLPYIDAAALAEREFVLDVVLAKMWDMFDDYIKREQSGLQNEELLYCEKKVRDGFVKVRKAYLILKAKEDKGGTLASRDEPVASELHELSASMNLRQEFQTLVINYIQMLSYDPSARREPNREGYLILAIDDIDMAAKMAQRILEQIRRFLSVPGIVIFMTADISRLKKMCENYYQKFYRKDKGALHRFINDYLEKVLPYYMRIYMPELNENHEGFQIEKTAFANLGLDLGGLSEKEVILKLIADRYGICFDGKRKKRHFLQSDSLRGLVNYFEHFFQIEEKDSCSWLKIDLKERLIERMANRSQREFIGSLLSRDYEDINELVLNYMCQYLNKSFALSDVNLGQVLYTCNLMEEYDVENAEFVNCILMLYSVMLGQTKGELREKIVGNTIFGSWEYAVSSTSPSRQNQAKISGFANRNHLVYEVTDDIYALIEEKKAKEALTALVERNRSRLLGWLYAMLFVNIDKPEDRGYQYAVTSHFDLKVIPSEEDDMPLEGKAEKKDDMASEEETEKKTEEKKESRSIKVYLEEEAQRASFRFMFREPKEDREKLKQLLETQFLELGTSLFPESEKKEEVNETAKTLCSFILEEFKKKFGGGVFPVQNVEMIYSIGKALQRETVWTDVEDNDSEIFLKRMQRYFKRIRDELKKQDNYYKEQLLLETDFSKSFENRLQAKIFLKWDQMEPEVRQSFSENFTEMFRADRRSVPVTRYRG